MFVRSGHVHDSAASAALRIHLFDRRVEQRVHAVFLEHAGVVIERARIRGKILAGAELQRVHEDTGDDSTAVQMSGSHEARVTHVQVAHGRHERDAFARQDASW